MSGEKYNRGNNSRRVSNKKNNRELSPREKLEIKKRLRRKEKKSTVIKRAITAAFLTIVILISLCGIYLFSFITSLNNSDVIAGVKPKANEIFSN